MYFEMIGYFLNRLYAKGEQDFRPACSIYPPLCAAYRSLSNASVCGPTELSVHFVLNVPAKA